MARHKIILLVLVMAVCTRLFYFLDFQHNILFDQINLTSDSYAIDLGAKSFVSGNYLAPLPASHVSPLYTYFVGIIYKVGGISLTNVWIVQFSLGILTVLLIYLIALELFNVRSAIIAATLYNFYGPALMYEGILLRASLITFLGTLSLYLLIQAQKKPNFFFLTCTGICISLFIQCRPNVVLIFLILPLMFYFTRNREGLILFTKITCIAFLASIPLLIRGWVVHGKLIFFSGSGPATLLVGNHPDYKGYGLTLDGLSGTEFTKDFLDPNGPIMSWSEFIPIFLDRLHSHPLELVGLYIRKVYFFFCSMEPYNNYDFLLFKKFSPLLNTPFSNFTLIASLALAGLVLSIGRGRDLSALYSFLLGSALAVILVLVLSRYRMPAVPFYAIFAGFSLDLMMRNFEQNDWIKSAKLLLLTLLLLLIFNLPNFNRGTKQNYADGLHYQIGIKLVDAKRYAGAIEPLMKYLKSNPHNTRALQYLGFAYWKNKDLKKALSIYQNISIENPGNAEVHFDLATLYASLDKKEKALFHMKYAERIFLQKNNLNSAELSRQQINSMEAR